ncbi:MAG: hypothetical protein QG628_733 [Patescibacteria group bacterium]|nr:hypothetical protein [Patescibacteria group bacterium]
MLTILNYIKLGRADQENVYHFHGSMRNPGKGVPLLELTYSAVNKWIDGTTVKTIVLYSKKHLPKLHLTHKSLKGLKAKGALYRATYT